MAERLTYIRLLVDNLPKMYDFYDNILNLNLKFGSKDDNYCEFETGTTDIGIFSRGEMISQTGLELPSSKSVQSNVMVIFQVESVDAYYSHLQEAGVKILTEPTDREEWEVRTLHCLDPEGNLIEINSPLVE